MSRLTMNELALANNKRSQAVDETADALRTFAEELENSGLDVDRQTLRQALAKLDETLTDAAGVRG